MKLVRILYLFFVFSLALFAGFQAGDRLNIMGVLFHSPIDETAIPGVTIPDNDQFNLLIIGADDSKNPDARLESIWLIAHADNTSRVTLIPVFPSHENPVQNLVLAEKFSLEHGKPSNEFWQAMQKTNLWWKGYIITDMSATINLIDMMGGIKVQDRLLDGVQAVSSIPPWESDPLMAVEYQMLLFKGVCNQIADNQKINLKTANELISVSMRSNKKVNEAFTNWSSQTELHGKLICSFPTLEQTLIEPLTASQ